MPFYLCELQKKRKGRVLSTCLGPGKYVWHFESVILCTIDESSNEKSSIFDQRQRYFFINKKCLNQFIQKHPVCFCFEYHFKATVKTTDEKMSYAACRFWKYHVSRKPHLKFPNVLSTCFFITNIFIIFSISLHLVKILL